MGDTYSFCKVHRRVFLSGKSRFLRDEYGFMGDDNPQYQYLGHELDREDYLFGLVKPKRGELRNDKEISDFVSHSFDRNEQDIVVTAASVGRAIDVLEELDKKVSTMPFDKKGRADRVWKEAIKKGEYGYVEDCADDAEYAYVSSCKKNIEIYKEVEKVYGRRAYHYGFPWCKFKGSVYALSTLHEVRKAMDNPENRDYVFLFTWI